MKRSKHREAGLKNELVMSFKLEDSVWLATTQTNKQETKLRGVSQQVRLGTILRSAKQETTETKGDG